MKNQQLVAAIHHLATERGLPTDTVREALELALVLAYKRNYGAPDGEIKAEVDPVGGDIHVFVEKTVVAEIMDDLSEISLAEARQIDPQTQLDGVVLVDSTPENFGRIAAQTAKQVIMQRIREAERENTYERFAEREGEIVTGKVQRYIPRTGDVIVSIDQAEGVLAREDQLPNERYHRGSSVRAYLVEVKRGSRGTNLKLSRTHRQMLHRLLESQVPEIVKGIVEVKAIAREPGYRSKVAVVAIQPGVEPVGCCVGMRGTRIQHIVDELNGEKIDVIAWSSDIRAFIRNALSPAKPIAVLLDHNENGRTAVVIVPDRQLSLSIGREGQNARLAAKLTGWRIDIKGETEAGADGMLALAQQQVLAEEDRKRDLLEAAQTILVGEYGFVGEPAAVTPVEPVAQVEAEGPAAVKAAPEAEVPAAAGAAEEQPVPEAPVPVRELEPAAVAPEEPPSKAEEAVEPEKVIDVGIAELVQEFEAEYVDEEEEESVLGDKPQKASKKRQQEIQRRRQVVYDEELGKTVAIRRRKRSTDGWGDDDYL
jgi:N utilization substance protein A